MTFLLLMAANKALQDQNERLGLPPPRGPNKGDWVLGVLIALIILIVVIGVVAIIYASDQALQ